MFGFKKKKSKKNVDVLQAQNRGEMQERGFGQELQGAAATYQDMMGGVRGSQKGGSSKQDSAAYMVIEQLMDKIQLMSQMSFSDNEMENRVMFDEMYSAHDALIIACNNYAATHNPYSSSGKERKARIERLRGEITTKFMDYDMVRDKLNGGYLSAADFSRMSWEDILNDNLPQRDEPMANTPQQEATDRAFAPIDAIAGTSATTEIAEPIEKREVAMGESEDEMFEDMLADVAPMEVKEDGDSEASTSEEVVTKEEETFIEAVAEDLADIKTDTSDSAESADVALDPAIEEEKAETPVHRELEAALESRSDIAVATGNDKVNALAEMRTQFASAKKGGIFFINSKAYKRILSGLDQIMDTFNSGSFSSNTTSNVKKIADMIKLQQTLSADCANYIESHSKASTDNGRARVLLAEQLKTMVDSDVKGLYSTVDKIATYNATQQEALTWETVMADARTRHIQVNVGKSGLKKMGGAASVVRQVTKDKVVGEEGGEGFFKLDFDLKSHGFDSSMNTYNEIGFEQTKKILGADEKISSFVRAHGRATPAYNFFNNFVKLTDEDKAYISQFYKTHKFSDKSEYKEIFDEHKENMSTTARSFLLHDLCSEYADKFDALVNISSDEMAKIFEFADVYFDVTKACNTANQNILSNAGARDIEKGDSLRLVERNVATSRMANLLGLGNMVVNTERATLSFEDGTEEKGMLMSAGKGVEAKKLLEGYKTINEQNKEVDATVPVNEMSGNLQKELSTLQVFDMIIGQIDRHGGNYLVSKNDKGQYHSISAIDNDFAFGGGRKYKGDKTYLDSDDDEAYDEMGGFNLSNTHSKLVVKDGRLYLRRMDLEFANRILELDPSVVRYMLMDLIEPENIDACIARLNAVKRAITVEMKERPSAFVDKDEDWNEETHDEFIQQRREVLKNERGDDQYMKTRNGEQSSYYALFARAHAKNSLSSEQRAIAAQEGAS